MISKLALAAAAALILSIVVTQTGLAQLTGVGQPIIQMDKSGAPKFSSVGGDVWCRVAQDRNLAAYQQYVAELIAAGGEVRGANYIVQSDRVEWFALVCGKIQKPQ